MCIRTLLYLFLFSLETFRSFFREEINEELVQSIGPTRKYEPTPCEYSNISK